MIKKVLGLLFIVMLSLIAVSGVSAADFTVTCSTNFCKPNPLSSFYSSSVVWYPGLSVTRTLRINNNSGQPVKIIAQNTSTTGDINQVIQFDILRTSDSVSIWSGSLYSFYTSGVQTLLSSGTTAGDFAFTAQMYTTASNAYQGKQTKFDLEFGFEIPTPTPSVCTAAKPPAPGGLSLFQQSNTDVKVTWSSVSDPVSGYYISWGTNTGADDTGTKSIGKTTEATVGGLTLDSKRYYFKIRAVNGCKEGEFSGLQSIGSGPDLFATVNPTSTPTPVIGLVAGAGTTTVTPEVKGASIEKKVTDETKKNNSDFPRILIFIFGFSSMGIFLALARIFFKHKNE